MAMSEFVANFPQFSVEVLAARCSDHAPLHASLHCFNGIPHRRTGFFRYEAWWQKNSEFQNVVKQVWVRKERSWDTWEVLKKKIDQSSHACRRWSSKTADPTDYLIEQKNKELSDLQDVGNAGDVEVVSQLQTEVNDLIECEDVKWRQKAHEEWLQFGDKNSKYFHASVNQCRKKNQIKQIMDMDGLTCTDQPGIEQAFLNYYKRLFRDVPPVGMGECLSGLSSKITDEMNSELLKPASLEEVLANRLKVVLPVIISTNQSAFIPGRLISDNILGAYETLHSMQTRHWGKISYVAVKLDMNKAYDRVEWGFLLEVMRRLGFAPKWVTSSDWGRLSSLLECYEMASGQQLNKEKISLFFSRNTSKEARDCILRLSSVPSTQRYDKYLGLPALVGRSRMGEFKGIKDRVWKRLHDWKTKFISQAGKEILLKAVIQAISTYSMSVFLLPMGLCSEINSLMQKFWWGHKDNASKIYWMSRKKLSFSKSKGGLGFWDLRCFNKALLAKQRWRLLHSPHSLAGKILKAKYFPKSTFLEATLGSRSSYAWRSILSAKDLLQEGLVWRIRDGTHVKIWGDKWIPTATTYAIQSPRSVFDETATVSELIDPYSKWWNVQLIRSIFSKVEAEIILGLPLSRYEQHDLRIWRGSSTGNILPTRVNLQKRGMDLDPVCIFCHSVRESVTHVLWECHFAMDVWGVCGGKLQKCSNAGASFSEVLEMMFDRWTIEEVELFAEVARRLWFRQNEVVMEGFSNTLTCW
ncbi:uncharacterized protein LOC133876208 [Alnus glutinosa]|uniref:uncharacterized protein LOC133876208 n=1 Tax=Alnus glutinosa TaxID=3517 RepID=UPI002D77EB77|nr:uncharacterized protein LOC133876208 [Alnus glutinosa]